jgi:hypothetical protein
MSDLQNQTPADTYKGLLQVGDYTNGVDSNAKYVSDGEGTPSALSISESKVGVGTTSPSAELDVNGNVVADEYALDGTGSSSSAVAIHAPAPNELAIRTNSTEAMRIDSSGNVAIGTTGTTAKLDVFGNIVADSSISSSNRNTISRKDLAGAWNMQPSLYLRLAPGTQPPANKDYGVIFSNADGIVLHADTQNIANNNYTPHFVVYAPSTTGGPGRVGINTVSPSAPLEVSSTTGGVVLPRMNTAQRNAISATDGEIVYDTQANAFYGYANNQWVALH